jgi:hypothetical protein
MQRRSAQSTAAEHQDARCPQRGPTSPQPVTIPFGPRSRRVLAAQAPRSRTCKARSSLEPPPQSSPSQRHRAGTPRHRRKVGRYFRQFLKEQAPPPGAMRPQYRALARTYTREQIRRNYEVRRQGGFAGREAEWERLELDMISAGREGRVENPVPLAKNWGDSR